MWLICGELEELTNTDGDGISIECHHDMWWGVYVTCQHGKIKGTSNGPIDLSRGFSTALERFEQLHKNMTPSINLRELHGRGKV